MVPAVTPNDLSVSCEAAWYRRRRGPRPNMRRRRRRRQSSHRPPVGLVGSKLVLGGNGVANRGASAAWTQRSTLRTADTMHATTHPANTCNAHAVLAVCQMLPSGRSWNRELPPQSAPTSVTTRSVVVEAPTEAMLSAGPNQQGPETGSMLLGTESAATHPHAGDVSPNVGPIRIGGSWLIVHPLAG